MSLLVLARRMTRLGAGFGRLWAASAVANLADGILLVGLPLVAVGLTRSPWQVSLVSTFATAPWLLVALFAGAIADRRDRRLLMTGAMGARVLLLAAVCVAAVAGPVNLVTIYVLVVFLGVAEVFADTTAQSMIPMLVERDRLGAANGRIIAAQTVANDFLGGPLAGVLVGVSAAVVVGVPAVAYLVAAGVLVSLPGAFRPAKRPVATVWGDIGEGLRYLVRHPVLRALALLAGLLNLAGAAYLAVFVLWAVGAPSAIGLQPAGYGLLMAALAVGGTLGALVAERLSRRVGEPSVLVVGASALGVLFLAPVLAPSGAVAAVAFVGVGLAVSVTKVVVVSLAQRLIREDLLGRVNATYRLVGLGAMPIGAAGGGALGTVTSLPVVFATSTLLCLVGAGVTARGVTAATIRRADAT